MVGINIFYKNNSISFSLRSFGGLPEFMQLVWKKIRHSATKPRLTLPPLLNSHRRHRHRHLLISLLNEVTLVTMWFNARLADIPLQPRTVGRQNLGMRCTPLARRRGTVRPNHFLAWSR